MSTTTCEGRDDEYAIDPTSLNGSGSSQAFAPLNYPLHSPTSFLMKFPHPTACLSMRPSGFKQWVGMRSH